MKIAIFCLGLIGKQRLKACLESGNAANNVFCIDPNYSELFIEENPWMYGVHFYKELPKELLSQISHAIVSVPHDAATELLLELLEHNIKVLVEKPLGRNLEEAITISSHKNSHLLSVGFNYRFMPAIQELKTILEAGDLGNLTNIRIDLGHGGAPNDKVSWKLDPVLAGGGVVLDPGIHLIDLLQFIFEVNVENLEISGSTTWKGFWSTGIEESVNIVGYLKDIPFNLTVSIVAWKTRFQVEVTGTEGYVQINGRGRTDGPQEIAIGKKWGWMTSSSQQASEDRRVVANKDFSLQRETEAWIKEESKVCGIADALNDMKIYDKVMTELNK